MRLFAKTLSKIALIGSLAASSVAAQSTINLPPNWPEAKMMLGLAWASAEDNLAITTYGGALTNFYTYRYLNPGNGAQAISEMKTAAESYPGTGRQSVITQLFIGDDINLAVPEARKDLLIAKMQDPSQIANFFNQLASAAVHINSAGSPVVVLEPDALGYILQARFHLEETAAPTNITSPSFTGAEAVTGEAALYKNILNFPAAVKPSSNGLSSSQFGYLEEYPNTIGGFMRAMVRASKELMPTAIVTGHAAAWAVFADGCSGAGSTSAQGDAVVRGEIDVLGTRSVVTWNDNDVELAAFSQVKFMRELYGWDEGAQAPALNGRDWPNAIAVEKGNSLAARDAGMIQNGPAQGVYPADRPAANTTSYFWNQSQNDRWLNWSKNISHGIKLPLIALRMPVGNGSLTQNQPFHYQDTFLDWLFSSSNWQTPLPGGSTVPVWSAENFAKFKEAGFIGLFIGRDGWPAAGTHYGNRANSNNTGWTSSGITGDGGYAITTFSNRADLSLGAIPVNFNEDEFANFTGFCDLVETTVKIETRGTVVAVSNNGSQILGAGNNDEYFLNGGNFAEELKDNTVIFYSNNSIFVPNVGRDEAAGGVVSTSNNTLDPNNQNVINTLANLSEIWVDIELDVPQMGVVLNETYSVAQRVKATFPLRYKFDIFDQMGQYVSGDSGTISEQDLLGLSTSKDNSLVTTLNMRVLPTDATGRQLGTGVYIFRGYIPEEKKWMCESPVDETGNPIATLGIEELIDPVKCEGAGGLWVERVRNAVVVKNLLPYTRLH